MRNGRLAIVAAFIAVVAAMNSTGCSGSCSESASGCDPGGAAGAGGSSMLDSGSGPIVPTPGHASVNGCNGLSKVTNLRGQSAVFIDQGLYGFDPRCALVDVDTVVTFRWNLSGCPLIGGAVLTPGGATPDPASPIPMTSTGSSVAVKFTSAGDYGFYCTFTGGTNPDIGAILVGVPGSEPSN